MLAAPAPEGLDLPLYASAKLDGVRAVVKDGRVWTRKLEPLPNAWVQQCLGHPLLEGLDGELCCGPAYADDVFIQTQSAVMSRDGRPDFMFYVFDYWNADATSVPYAERLRRLQDAFALPVYVAHPYIELLDQRLVHTLADLTDMQEDYLERGYEGLILRNPATGYKFGRSTDNLNGATHLTTGKPLQPWTMMKLKRFSDSEARITGVVQLMRNENESEENALGLSKRSTAKDGLTPAGVLGSLEVEDVHTGVKFRIGSGFDAEDRVRLWAIKDKLPGLLVKYKHFEIGVKVAPRFPIWLGFVHPNLVETGV